MLVIEPFNAVYCVFVGTVFFAVALFAFFLGKKPIETRRKVFLIFSAAAALLLLFYKFSYRLDAQFIEDYPKYWGEYTVFNELPFNPCNVCLLLLPIGLWKKNDYLLSFCFFMGLISTLIAICIPQQGYAGYSVFCWHTFGFFLLHSLGVAIPAAVAALGLYRPKYRDIFKSLAVLVPLAVFSFLLSLLLRVTGLCEFANYMFTMDPEGNPLLEFWYRLLPVKGLYILPNLLIYFPCCALICLLFGKVGRKGEKTSKFEPTP